MTDVSRNSDHQIRQADVPRLPFTAGVLLAISALLTVVLGLYTIRFWWGWLFIGFGILVAATSLMLLFKVAGARLVAVAMAVVSIVIAAIWVVDYPWFGGSIIAFDVVVIYALARSKVGMRSPGE